MFSFALLVITYDSISNKLWLSNSVHGKITNILICNMISEPVYIDEHCDAAQKKEPVYEFEIFAFIKSVLSSIMSPS